MVDRPERDVAALEDEFVRHLPLLRSIIRRILGDEQDVGDVVQNVWIKASTRLEKFRGGNMRAWLCRIAKNETFSHLRRHSHDSVCVPIQDEEHSIDIPDRAPSALDRLINKRCVAIILEAVERLPPARQAAVKLVYFQEMMSRDAADLLQVCPITVGTHLHRARQQLARLGRLKKVA